MRKFIIVLSLLGLGACASHPTPPQANAVKPTILDTIQKTISKVIAVKPSLYARDVLGKDSAWVQQKLGVPNFIRADLEAHIWMYKNKDCVLNLFLYPGDTTNPELSVLHLDARDPSGQNMDRNLCLATY